MNQSKLEVITCSWEKARENMFEWVRIGFGFTSDWMKNWREFFKPIVWSTKCKTSYFSTLKWKPLYTSARGKVATKHWDKPQSRAKVLVRFSGIRSSSPATEKNITPAENPPVLVCARFPALGSAENSDLSMCCQRLMQFHWWMKHCHSFPCARWKMAGN